MVSLQTVSDRTRALQGPLLIHCLLITPRDYAILWRFGKPSNLFGFLSNPCEHAGKQMSASQALFLPYRHLKSVSEVRSITGLFIAPDTESHPREPSRSNSCFMPELVQ
jgi:hypothetical protein